jgi:hypothetical protein
MIAEQTNACGEHASVVHPEKVINCKKNRYNIQQPYESLGYKVPILAGIGGIITLKFP